MGNRFSVKKRKFQKISPSLCTPKFQLQKVSIETLWTGVWKPRFERLFLSRGKARAMTTDTSPHRRCETKSQNQFILTSIMSERLHLEPASWDDLVVHSSVLSAIRKQKTEKAQLSYKSARFSLFFFPANCWYAWKQFCVRI